MVSCFNFESDEKLNSILSISRTIFVCVVLLMGALYFTKDANDLVLTPIANMVKKVKEIGKNPLKAVEMEEAEALAKLIVEHH